MFISWHQKVTQAVREARTQVQNVGVERVLYHERSCGHVPLVAEDAPAGVTVNLVSEARCKQCEAPLKTADGVSVMRPLTGDSTSKVLASDEAEAASLCAHLLETLTFDKGVAKLDAAYVARRLAAWRQSGGR